MSEMAKEARRKARDKAYALVNPKPGAVDASDYGPEEDLGTFYKTGERPKGRQQFRKGGKVVDAEGAKAKVHAGMKPRAGMKVRLGEKHPDAIEDKKLIDRIVKPSARTDNRAAKSAGGDLALAAASPAGFAAKELGLKSGGRTARASGGRTKGKTNINIIIGAGAKPDPVMPPMGAAPVPPPMPNAAMPGTSPSPVGAGAPPPMGPTGVPMARKAGGRTIKMEYGAGGGKGRLEKKDAY